MNGSERRRRWTTPLALALAVWAVAAAVATLALAVANRASLPNIDAADPTSIITPIGIAAVGALIASRRPRNPTGWLFLFIAVVTAMLGVEEQYARLALITHPGLPGAVWALWLNNWTWAVNFPTGAVGLALLTLPDGHLPSARWRPVAWALVAAAVGSALLGMLGPGPMTTSWLKAGLPNPLGVSPLQGIFQQGNGPFPVGMALLGLAAMLVAASAPLVRMLRARGDERQQLKWIAYAVLVTAALYGALGLISIPASSSLGSLPADAVISFGFGIALPVAAGVAIFKYRLYDIDIVISRTLVYGSLAVLITAVYVGIAVGIGAAIGGGGKPNLGLSILATAIVAVGFQPVRERLQKVANRLVYGKRATPYEVLSQFSERVAESYAVVDVMPRMARVLAEGTGAQRADVWLRSGDTVRVAASWPVDGAPRRPVEVIDGSITVAPGGDRMVPVRQSTELLGALSVSKRAGEQLTPMEEKLLDDLAHQAGLVLRNVGLTADLQLRLEELRASRQRVVTAQDAERRRLERNLHDGAQQHLVALKVKLGLAEMLLARDPQRASATLEQLKTDADEALETLRDLARGIYPPLLADRGLVAAVESQARKATVAVRVDGQGTGRYSQEVEAAVYFSVLEALQNVQKYAGASSVRVTLCEKEDRLEFSVEDDGRGFDVATVSRGSGLTNMEDRLDALGGELRVVSSVGKGTSLQGWLAIAPQPVIVALVAASG